MKKEGFREFAKYITTGILLASLDFFFEFIGTSIKNWTYHKSVLFLFGRIPVELLLFFFAGGVIAAFIYKNAEDVYKPIRLNTLLYLLMVFGALVYSRDFYFRTQSNILYIAMPFGIWGLLNIKEEGSKISALVIATSVAFLDSVIEGFFLTTGEYAYLTPSLPWDVPLVYAFGVLGLFGFMERLDVLDKFFDHSIVRGWLHILGIQREMYKEKIGRAVLKAKKRLNGVKD